MKVSLRDKLVYATGSLGISMITVIHMLFLVYVFFPADNAGIAYVIPQDNIVFGLTVLGIILFSSRMFDVITDPIIAHLSDKSKNPKGKRIPFMAKAAIPMGLSYVGVFFVPFVNEVHELNVLWLTVFLFLSALFLTLYTIPYYSLMVDMAKTVEDKVDLGTFTSAFWFGGFLMVSFATTLWDLFETSLAITRIQSIQLSFVLIGIIAVMCLFVPVLMLDEKKFKVKKRNQNIGLFKALKQVGKNKNFIRFIISNTTYGIATFIFETGLIYYITVLALKDESIQGLLTSVIGVLTLLMFPLINKLSKKKGKKPIMLIGFTLFALSFLLIASLGMGGFSINLILALIVILTPFSQATFGILPGVVTADCAAYDEYESGENHSGMYMAVTSFSQKLGGSLGTIIFTGFLILGKDVGHDAGIRTAVLFSAALCVIGFISVFQYNEKKILSYSNQDTLKIKQHL